MQDETLYSEENEATYCPEDNKLRLYVGHVPKPEYLALRSEGWKSTPKQSLNGGGEFAATWNPSREDTATAYAGIIGDEDQGPAERAADRAERFGGYLDKRRAEAHDHADSYEAGPSAHGYQNPQKAERAAAKHDRHADRACNAWSKAEYWQSRTAGVISNALYLSGPGVRMGRIKKLESEIRTRTAGRYLEHCKLRLTYENQMLEAQGGRAASVDMVPGGFIGSHQIHKVNKSNATGRVVSVAVKVPQIHGYTYRVANEPGTDYALEQIKTERLAKDAYTAPTAEELEAFKAMKKAEKVQKKATAPKRPPLVNPTAEEAQKLQDVWNDQAEERNAKRQYSSELKRTEPQEMTQAAYSARSKGSYSHCKPVYIGEGGAETYEQYRGNVEAGAVCKVRQGSGGRELYSAYAVIRITDKPSKALPAAVWPAEEAAPEPKAELLEAPFNLVTEEAQDGERIQAASDKKKEHAAAMESAQAEMVLI